MQDNSKYRADVETFYTMTETHIIPDPEKLKENAQNAANLLKAMANERRLLILCQLMQGEKNVTELEHRLPLSQSALSQHLAKLRKENLVKTRREAQTIYYSLQGEEVTAVLGTLHALFCEKNPPS